MNRRLAVLPLGVALVCYVVSLFLPVWSMRLQYDGDYVYLGSVYSPGPFTYTDVSTFGSYSTSHIRYFTFMPVGHAPVTALSPSVQLPLFILMAMTIVTVFLVTARLVTLYRNSEAHPKRRTDSLTVAASFMAIMTPIVFAALWPSAFASQVPEVESSFWGQLSGYDGNPEYTGTLTYGPSIGWYLQIVAFVLIILAMTIVSVSRGVHRTEPESPPAVHDQGLVAVVIIIAVVLILFLSLR